MVSIIDMDTSFASSNYSSGNSLATSEPSVMERMMPETLSGQKTAALLHQSSQRSADFLATFPFYLLRFWNQNRRAITNTLLVLAAITALKVVFAVLDALDDIPFLTTLLQIVGLGYSLWFVNRYLLKAQHRQELVQQIQGATRDLSAPPASLRQAEAES